VYSEITVSSITSDGTHISIKEGDELLHAIVVFKKGYKLTQEDKDLLQELELDYMFER
jgi:hypothetical protein